MLSPIPVPISPAGTPPARPGPVLSAATIPPSPNNLNVVATPAQSITPNGPGPLNLADCQVTAGYAVFVRDAGGADSEYDVFFVPGNSSVESLPVQFDHSGPNNLE